jgi:serine/threonine-protein kinase
MSDVKADAKAIFLQALECQAPDELHRFLDDACSGDAALRARAEELLRAHQDAGNFLGGLPPLDATQDKPLAECAGTVIGPYKLLEQIGEGGMGLVFMADQLRPVRRRVAVKVLKPGMDTRQVVARFEAERQALALMDHPHIAKMFDAGTTASGRPFFVMELVRGVPITEFCDQRRLTTRQRLELFATVCQAVQHAHQKGIIHRDLKPSNVLVTLHDTVAVPKVIDFGIAKATSQPLTERTLFTHFAQMIGTPLYMSPEQAEMNSLDVDTRSDVYALGVLLYELLTGTTPFESETLKKVGLDELRRIIREDEPPRPSARLSTLAKADLSTVAERRGADPKRLSQAMRGELDWIVMRCLEKDRNRRYESASALAADVQRYVNDEPVLACPPSASYRLKKFSRRHRGGLAVAALVFVFVTALAGGIGWVVGDRAARQAEVEGRVAEALAVAEAKLPQGNPRDPELITAARKAEAQLLSGLVGDELRQRVERVLADVAMLAKLEQIRLDQAAVKYGNFDTVGADAAYAQTFREYGIDVEALGVQEAGARIRQRDIGKHLAAALDMWAGSRLFREREERARGNRVKREGMGWKQLLQVAQEVDPDPWCDALRKALVALATGKEGSKELRTLVASTPIEKLSPGTLALFGGALRDGGMAPLAVELLRKGQRLYPADFWINHDLGMLLADSMRPPRFEQAIGYYRAALALRPNSPGVHLNFGNALQSNSELDEAMVCYKEAIRLKRDYAKAHGSLGNVLLKKDQLDEAIASFREAIRLKKDDAKSHNNLGVALLRKGQRDEAILSFKEAIRLNKDLFEAHRNLGPVLAQQGQLDEAILSFQEAVRLHKKDVEAHFSLGLALRTKGRLDEAILSFKEAVRLKRDFAAAHYGLGLALRIKGRLDEAILSFQEAVRLDKQDAAAHNTLGLALRDKGQLDDAIASFGRAIQLNPDSEGTYTNLGYALLRKGRHDDAITYFRKAILIKEDFVGGHEGLANALNARGRWAEAEESYCKALQVSPNYDRVNNDAAWFWATCPDAKFRDPQKAVRLAQKATQLKPKNGDYWNTLGVARYRVGQLTEAITALEESMRLRRGGDASDWFFVAMAHWQQGHKDKAREYFQKAVRSMDKYQPRNQELRRFRAEAAALLGITNDPHAPGKEKPAPQP